MPTTDYHALIRDAVAQTVQGLHLGPPTHAVDDLEAELPQLSVPCIAVCCVGPEYDRPEWATNQSDGRGYPVLVALLSAGVANGAKSPAPEMTLFRRKITVAFNNQRLSGVDQVGWCEVSPDGVVFDKDSPAFQKLSTMLTVVAVGKFPRS